MIAQYIIDWKCVRNRIECNAASDELAVERLRGYLSSLREKIFENGALIVDEDSRLLNDLNDIKRELEDLVSEDQRDCGAVYFDMKQELESFLNAYENAGYIISVEENEDVVQACVNGWCEHTRRISPQGVKGGVVITDRSEDLEKGTLAVESWDSYVSSETEFMRRRWRQGLSFNQRSCDDFKDCLNSFAATSCDEVLFVDKYWSSVGVSNAGGGATTRQERYAKSTKLFLKPFLNNPDVSRVDFITAVPEYRDDEAAIFCLNSEGGLCAIVEAWGATRRGDMKINVMLVEPNNPNSDAQFHNRYMINERFTVALLNGMDVCDRWGNLIDFQLILFGATTGATKMERGHIVGHRVHSINQNEVDVVAPYSILIRDTPQVSVSLNG